MCFENCMRSLGWIPLVGGILGGIIGFVAAGIVGAAIIIAASPTVIGVGAVTLIVGVVGLALVGSGFVLGGAVGLAIAAAICARSCSRPAPAPANG